MLWNLSTAGPVTLTNISAPIGSLPGESPKVPRYTVNVAEVNGECGYTTGRLPHTSGNVRGDGSPLVLPHVDWWRVTGRETASPDKCQRFRPDGRNPGVIIRDPDCRSISVQPVLQE